MSGAPPETGGGAGATVGIEGAAGLRGRLAATGLVLAAAYGPLLGRFAQDLWEKPHYQHFPFVLAAAGWFFWIGFARAAPRHPSDSIAQPGPSEPRTSPSEPRSGAVWAWAAAGLGAAAWALLAGAYFARSPWLAAVSLQLLAGAACCRVRRAWRYPYLLGVWLLPWLVIPPPLQRDVWLIALLQRASSRLSSAILDRIGVLHLMDGNTLAVGDKQLFVDEACSGIVSVMSIVAAAAIYAVWRRRPLAQAVTLAALGVGWAVLMNAVRITLIAYLYDRHRIDWSEGAPHLWLGLALFASVFGLVVSTEHVVRCALSPIEDAWRDVAVGGARYGAGLASVWDRLVGADRTEAAPPAQGAGAEASAPEPSVRLRPLAMGFAPLAAFALLGASQLGADELFRFQDAAEVQQRLDRALAVGREDLPAELAGCRQTEFWPEERDRDDIFGAHSRVFRYADERGVDYLLSLDFPFGSDLVHNLEECYGGRGWRRSRRENLREASAGEDWPYVELLLEREGEEYAAVLFCGFDEYGRPGRLPGVTLTDSIAQVFRRREAQAARRSYQVQVWMPRRNPGDVRELDVARELLLAARRSLRELVIGSPPGAADSEESP